MRVGRTHPTGTRAGSRALPDSAVLTARLRPPSSPSLFAERGGGGAVRAVLAKARLGPGKIRASGCVCPECLPSVRITRRRRSAGFGAR